MFNRIRHSILAFIDFFHKPFSRFIDKQTFRYVACGGSNQVFGIFLYWVSYNFILHQHDIPLFDGIKITAPIAAYLISFCFSFPMGFFLSRYIVFPESALHKHVQFFRYIVLIATCLILSYCFIKFFVEVCGFYPTPSNAATSVILAVFSYFSQRKFTFKVEKPVAQ
jgi:putative flippase GtrA